MANDPMIDKLFRSTEKSPSPSETRPVGERYPGTEPTFTKYDSGKSRPDLIPGEVLLSIGDVLAYGAKKYAPNNWQRPGTSVNRYHAAALRHIAAWDAGEEIDNESGLHHIDHALCCLIFMKWLIAHGVDNSEKM